MSSASGRVADPGAGPGTRRTAPRAACWRPRLRVPPPAAPGPAPSSPGPRPGPAGTPRAGGPPACSGRAGLLPWENLASGSCPSPPSAAGKHRAPVRSAGRGSPITGPNRTPPDAIARRQAGDFWRYALFAAVAWIRAAAIKSGVGLLLIYLRKRLFARGLNEPAQSSQENPGKVVGVRRARSSYMQKDGQQGPDHYRGGVASRPLSPDRRGAGRTWPPFGGGRDLARGQDRGPGRYRRGHQPVPGRAPSLPGACR